MSAVWTFAFEPKLKNWTIRNVVHRHEPPVTSTPVRVLFQDKDRDFIVVDKPGSIVRSSIGA